MHFGYNQFPDSPIRTREALSRENRPVADTHAAAKLGGLCPPTENARNGRHINDSDMRLKPYFPKTVNAIEDFGDRERYVKKESPSKDIYNDSFVVYSSENVILIKDPVFDLNKTNRSSHDISRHRNKTVASNSRHPTAMKEGYFDIDYRNVASSIGCETINYDGFSSRNQPRYLPTQNSNVTSALQFLGKHADLASDATYRVQSGDEGTEEKPRPNSAILDSQRKNEMSFIPGRKRFFSDPEHSAVSEWSFQRQRNEFREISDAKRLRYVKDWANDLFPASPAESRGSDVLRVNANTNATHTRILHLGRENVARESVITRAVQREAANAGHLTKDYKSSRENSRCRESPVFNVINSTAKSTDSQNNLSRRTGLKNAVNDRLMDDILGSNEEVAWRRESSSVPTTDAKCEGAFGRRPGRSASCSDIVRPRDVKHDYYSLFGTGVQNRVDSIADSSGKTSTDIDCTAREIDVDSSSPVYANNHSLFDKRKVISPASGNFRAFQPDSSGDQTVFDMKPIKSTLSNISPVRYRLLDGSLTDRIGQDENEMQAHSNHSPRCPVDQKACSSQQIDSSNDDCNAAQGGTKRRDSDDIQHCRSDHNNQHERRKGADLRRTAAVDLHKATRDTHHLGKETNYRFNFGSDIRKTFVPNSPIESTIYPVYRAPVDSFLQNNRPDLVTRLPSVESIVTAKPTFAQPMLDDKGMELAGPHMSPVAHLPFPYQMQQLTGPREGGNFGPSLCQATLQNIRK